MQGCRNAGGKRMIEVAFHPLETVKNEGLRYAVIAAPGGGRLAFLPSPPAGNLGAAGRSPGAGGGYPGDGPP